MGVGKLSGKIQPTASEVFPLEVSTEAFFGTIHVPPSLFEIIPARQEKRRHEERAKHFYGEVLGVATGSRQREA